MTKTNLQYRVDSQQMDEYLKKTFTNRATTFVIIVAVVMTMFVFILFNQDSEFPILGLVLIVAVIVGAFLFGLKSSNEKLRELSETEFLLTNDSIVQTKQDIVKRDFKFSEIAVVNKTKLGTTIVKGNWLTKIDFYRPKKISPYQLDDPTTIFVPTITTNYSQLIDNIQRAKRQT